MLVDAGDRVPTETEANEFYSTDVKDVEAFLQVYLFPNPRHFNGKLILDPAAGGSERAVMPYPSVLTRLGADVCTIDIRESSRAEQKCDFLRVDPLALFADRLASRPSRKFDMVITNPPFSLYRQFVEHGLRVAPVVVLLLPLGVMEPRVRRREEDVRWWRKFRPTHVFTHPRLKFGGSGSSAHQQYGHFVWHENVCRSENDGRWRSIEMIPIDDCDDLENNQGRIV